MFQALLASFSAVGGASALLLMLVPVGRITITYPDRLVMEMSCSSGSPLSLSLYQQHPCNYLHPYTYETEVKLEACGFACQAFLNPNDTNSILHAKTYGIQMHSIEHNKSRTFQYTLTEKDIQQTVAISEAKHHKTLKNNERYTTAIRRLSKNTYFFPAYSLFGFACERNESKYNCIYGYKEERIQFSQNFQTNTKFGIHPTPINEHDSAEERQQFQVDYIDNQKLNPTCLRGFGQAKDHISVNIPLFKQYADPQAYKSLDLGNCAARCIVTTPRPKVCSNQNEVIELDMQVTFWSYLVVRVFIGIVSGTSFAMFEGAVIAILREHKADYGLQRIYATFGGMISSPLSGWLIDYASRGKGYTDYR